MDDEIMLKEIVEERYIDVTNDTTLQEFMNKLQQIMEEISTREDILNKEYLISSIDIYDRINGPKKEIIIKFFRHESQEEAYQRIIGSQLNIKENIRKTVKSLQEYKQLYPEIFQEVINGQ